MSGIGASSNSRTEHSVSPELRTLVPIQIANSSIAIDVMIFGGQRAALTPLVILNSIELPIPPSVAFCQRMWRAGYQVIFVRRPGFGETPGLPSALLTEQEVKSGAAVVTEAALLKRLFDTLQLKKIALLGLGTSNSVSLRLAQISSDIQRVIYANPLFNQEVWDIVRPNWLKSMIRQTMTSRSGLRMTVAGLKSTLRRRPEWFYRNFTQKSAGDQAYLKDNLDDFLEASRLLQTMSPDMVYYDLQMALIQDTHLPPHSLQNTHATLLCGTETTPRWKQQITQAAKDLNTPIVFAPSGDIFVPYASPDTLLDVLKANVAVAAG